MPEHSEQYLFAAVKVPTKLSEILFRHQQTLVKQLKERNIRCKALPRRLFLLPVFDFGLAPTQSDEAVIFAFRKHLTQVQPPQLQLGQVKFWPTTTQPEQLVVEVADHQDRLRTLRDKCEPMLRQYGFEPQKGEWAPVIPLIRLLANGEKPDPDFLQPPIELPDINEEYNVHSISVYGRQMTGGRGRFLVLGRLETSTMPSSGTVEREDEADLRLELSELLRERITARKLRFSKARRAERNKAIREEEHSLPPQPDAEFTDID